MLSFKDSSVGSVDFFHWSVFPTVEIKRVMVIIRRMKYIGNG